MAKKKSDAKLILNFVLLVLSAVTLVSLFVNMVGSTVKVLGWTASGTDLIGSALAGELKGLEGGAASLYVLGAIEEHAFVVSAFQWCYIVAMVAAAACFVFTVLECLHIRLTIFNKLCALVLAVAALATIIFGFVVAGAIGEYGAVGIGTFLLVAGIAYSVLYFVKERE